MLLASDLALEACIRRNERTSKDQRLDPFAFDQPEDPIIPVTKRQLSRVALAAEIMGRRAIEEGWSQPPFALLEAALAILGGRSLLDACLNRSAFLDLLLLHRCHLPLCADVLDLQQALRNADARAVRKSEAGAAVARRKLPGGRRRRLYSCSVSSRSPAGQFNGFGAAVTKNEREFEVLLAEQWGIQVAEEACISVGFDWSEPIANALVSGAVADMLMLAAEAPDSALADGLSVFVGQRFRE